MPSAPIVGQPAGSPPGRTSTHKTIGVIACVVAFAVVLGLVIGLTTRTEKPETVAQKYLNAEFAYDYDTINTYSAISLDVLLEAELASNLGFDENLTETLMDKYGTANLKNIFEGPLKDSAQENWTSQYGTDVTATFVVLGTTVLSQPQIYSAISDMRSELGGYGVDPDTLFDFGSIKAMTKVHTNFEISGSDGSDSFELDVYCVKVGRAWKVLGDPASGE